MIKDYVYELYLLDKTMNFSTEEFNKLLAIAAEENRKQYEAVKAEQDTLLKEIKQWT